MQRSDTQTISIDAPARAVIDLITDPAEFPRWAAGFARSVQTDGDDWLVDTGAISPGDLSLFHYADTPEEDFEMLKSGLIANHLEPESRRGMLSQTPPNPEEVLGPEFARTL